MRDPNDPATGWPDDELARFFGLSLDLFSICDFAGNFVRVNPAWERTLGYAVEELLSRPSAELVHPDDREVPNEDRKKLLTGLETVTFRNRLRCKDGSTRWFLWSATVSVPRERIYSVGRDITAEIEAQKRVLRLVEDLETKNRELREAEAQKAALTAYVVHDLKNPLAGILANADFLQEEPGLSAAAADALSDVLEAAGAMDRMILNLLDIARSEDGALIPQRADVDVVPMLEELRANAEARGRSLAVEVEWPALRAAVDPDLVRRILSNLVDNAIKYTPQGGSIRIEARPDGAGGLELRVRDEGPGIPEDLREKIFDKYARLDSDGPHAAGSRGLGLAFCKLAALAHGGRIWIEPSQPAGSTFCVHLPAQER